MKIKVVVLPRWRSNFLWIISYLSLFRYKNLRNKNKNYLNDQHDLLWKVSFREITLKRIISTKFYNWQIYMSDLCHLYLFTHCDVQIELTFWITLEVSYKKQELFSPREHLDTSRFFGEDRLVNLFILLCFLFCLSFSRK